MERAERDRFVATTDQKDLAYGESACLETPPDFFAIIHTHFHFDIDLTANAENHLLPLWFGPGSPLGKPDALTTPWYWLPTVHQERAGGVLSHPTTRGYSNPPYGAFIERILEKAVEEAARGFTSVFLLPMRASSWYTKIVLVHATFLLHLEPRLTFWYKGAPKPTAKVKWRKKYEGDPQYTKEADGCVYLVGVKGATATRPLLQPANALFDSILVGFCPDLSGLPHIPYTVQPKVWRWKEQPIANLL